MFKINFDNRVNSKSRGYKIRIRSSNNNNEDKWEQACYPKELLEQHYLKIFSLGNITRSMVDKKLTPSARTN